MSRFLGICVLGVVLSAIGAAHASAQGFGVYEQGACQTARGGAGVADPCNDGSGVFFNPASIVFDGRVATLGGFLIGPYGDFTDTSNTPLKGTVSTLNKKWYPVPNIYVAMPLGKRLAFGLGVMAPYGLTTDWPTNSQGRFLGYKSVVEGVYVQPTVAMKLSEKVSVGFGIDITHINVELSQRLDLSTQVMAVHPVYGPLTFGQLNLLCPAALCGSVPLGTDFGDVQLKGTAWHAGYHIGFQVKPTDRFAVGARYLSGQSIDVTNGTITTEAIPVPGVRLPLTTSGGLVLVPVDTVLASQFASGATLSDQTAKTTLPMPAQFVAGVMVKAAPAVKLFFDYQWTNWKKFDVLKIDGQYLHSQVIEAYNNGSGVRFGTEIAVSEKSTVSGGVNLHGPAAPDQSVTPNLPEGSRREFMVGFGTQLSKSLHFDATYMYLHQPERAGRAYAGSLPAPVPADNNGVYNFNANLIGFALSIRF